MLTLPSKTFRKPIEYFSKCANGSMRQKHFNEHIYFSNGIFVYLQNVSLLFYPSFLSKNILKFPQPLKLCSAENDKEQ